MKRLIIGIDGDEVLWPMMEHLLLRYRKASRHVLLSRDITEWDLTPFLAQGWSTRKFWQLRTPDLYDELEAPWGAQEAVGKLHRAGHYLVLVTADKRDEMVKAKLRTLHRLYGNYIQDAVFAREKRAAVPGLDLLIDDGLHNDPDILYSAPWNVPSLAHRAEPPQLRKGQVRAHNWYDVLECISTYGVRW